MPCFSWLKAVKLYHHWHYTMNHCAGQFLIETSAGDTLRAEMDRESRMWVSSASWVHIDPCSKWVFAFSGFYTSEH